MPTRSVVLIDGLGFGFANVVVAVPQAWIDVRDMADIDDVATAFRHHHGRKMRVATKYINLTRDFFSAHGIIDYRIVESSGATEGAPAAGTAEMIVDITTTGTTLAANGAEDRRGRHHSALAGEPGGGARRRLGRNGSATLPRVILDRHRRAGARARVSRGAGTLCRKRRTCWSRTRKQKFGVETPFGGPTSSGLLTLHCPPDQVYALTNFLRENGAEAVAVADLDYVFSRDNPLFAKLERRSGRCG